jgi:ABC-type dipeptide/oligopeptide/nickel transport system permease component
MMSWVLRRMAAALLLTVLGTAVLIVLVHALPGDPLVAIIGDRALDPAAEAALRARWGIDRPVGAVLADFFAGLIRGDLGMSLQEQRPVAHILLERTGPTILLGGLTLLVNFTIGLALGLWSGLHPDTLRARTLGTMALVSYAVPAFVIGLLLVWAFAVQWPILPAAGYVDPLLADEAGALALFGDRLRHLALPLLTMVLATIAVPIRQQRSAVLGTRHATWVTAAHARGVTPPRIRWRHIWRPALTPVITLLGLWLPMLVSGAVFVESVFAWPGLGSLIASAAAARDVPVVIGAGALLILVVQLGSLLADVLYRVVDPEQREA